MRVGVRVVVLKRVRVGASMRVRSGRDGRRGKVAGRDATIVKAGRGAVGPGGVACVVGGVGEEGGGRRGEGSVANEGKRGVDGTGEVEVSGGVKGFSVDSTLHELLEESVGHARRGDEGCLWMDKAGEMR